MRTILAEVLEMLLDLPILSMMVEVAALTANTASKTRSKCLETGHGTIWKNPEKFTITFAMTKDHTILKYSLHKPYQVILPTREA